MPPKSQEGLIAFLLLPCFSLQLDLLFPSSVAELGVSPSCAPALLCLRAGRRGSPASNQNLGAGLGRGL